MTITEALVELGLIKKKIAHRQSFIEQYAYRLKNLVDPLADQGGSRAAVAEAFQSIHDLADRTIELRSAIAEANRVTIIAIGSVSRSIQDWLTWRRDVYPLLSGLLSSVQQVVRTEHRTRQLGQRIMSKEEVANDLIVNLDEKTLAEDGINVLEAFERLDGLLQVKNATTDI
jgi:hypothetical protein